MLMSVEVPRGMYPGQALCVNGPDGRQFNITIPHGIPPNRQIQVDLPDPEPPAMMMVTIPQGVGPGQMLQVRAPDGQLVQLTVPHGSGPGSQVQIRVPNQSSNEDNDNPYQAAASRPAGATAAPQPAPVDDWMAQMQAQQDEMTQLEQSRMADMRERESRQSNRMQEDQRKRDEAQKRRHDKQQLDAKKKAAALKSALAEKRRKAKEVGVHPILGAQPCHTRVSRYAHLTPLSCGAAAARFSKRSAGRRHR
jgi:hypothetical protein